jgi:hypothetical protein
MPAVLSKPVDPNKEWINANLYGFTSNNITLVILKTFAKGVGIKASGNKPELYQRCLAYQHVHCAARIIQQIFRGYYVRLWLKLKLGTKQLPVNDTDFYTLEPISDIPLSCYLHYTEPTTQTSYVFNLVSLHKLISLHNTKSIENPYTRESMNNYVNTLIHICRLTMLVLHSNTSDSDTHSNTHSETTIEKIRNLFIDIDLLGHYTNISWFLNLSNKDLCKMHANLVKIWKKLPLFTKDTIKVNNIPKLNQTTNIDDTRDTIINIGKTLVNTDGDKALGSYYFLMALSTVSMNARQQYAYLIDEYNTLVNSNG